MNSPTYIPVGLATRLGQIVAAIFGLIALVTAVLNGDHSQETILALILSAGTVFVLMGGRYAQAALANLAHVLEAQAALNKDAAEPPPR